MKEGATHTWDIVVNYQRCPSCGYILENRQKYVRIKDSDILELVCPRCKILFKAERYRRKRTLFERLK